ncbi:helix-turn-helix domain-containing protein [Leptospira levettii]|uniref:helix-turn-helix domain-containing protein n=1 Tax=Leptospira levettii TaxID=2023178 RepID=UPI000C2A3C34|nr:helix-turn-helix transcriptional regulator [Leptospira levettii]PJZ89504.1 hypothetical protein CH368_05980 [Leptospira levettii]
MENTDLTPDPIEVGKRLDTLIVVLDLTQYEFAKSIGVSPSQVSGWRKGKHMISSRPLRKMKEIYNISEKWYFSGEGEMFTDPPPNTSTRQMSEFEAVIELSRKLYDNPLLFRVASKLTRLTPADLSKLDKLLSKKD